MVGFVNVFKPKGITSNAVLSKIKKQFGIKKLGHMGTLDPLASGVLPVGIGKATKMFNYFQEKCKKYRAEITFGFETSTLDSEGEIVRTESVKVTMENFVHVLTNFPKQYLQTPPNFSAKSVNGVRAYKLARNNVDFTLPPKEVHVYEFNNIKKVSNNCYIFEVSCSSGTYIRSLIKDIAAKLNTVATMTNLVRIETGVFNENNAIELEELLKLNNINSAIIPVENLFNFSKINFENCNLKALENGNDFTMKLNINKNTPFFGFYNNKLYGVYELNNGLVKLLTYLKEEV